MLEVYGDIWDYTKTQFHSNICITTNGTVKNNGEAVMGRGVARQCKDLFPYIAKELGDNIKENGNIFQIIHHGPIVTLYSFPVKIHWREMANLLLISSSAEQLSKIAQMYPHLTYLLPRPGCGNGQRDWETEVKPLIEPLLPDNVHVITNRS